LFDSDGDDPGIVSYTSGLPTANPTTIADVVQFDHVAIALSQQTTPERLVLGRSALQSQMPWFVTQSGATELEFENQGSLNVSTYDRTTGLATASNLIIHFHYVVEFRERLPAATTIERLTRQVPTIKRKTSVEDIEESFENLLVTRADAKQLRRK
jgi:hypothetical protein